MKSIYLFNRLFNQLFKTPKNKIFTLIALGFILSFSTVINAQSTWNDPGATVLDDQVTGAYSIRNSLRDVNGRPAIAFFDADNNYLINYQRATDNKGTNWNPSTIADVTTFGGIYTIDMEVVNGNPAIASSPHFSFDINYVRAFDANGDFWGSTTTVVSSPSTAPIRYVDLEQANGHPAIAYYDSDDGDLYFVRATDASGTSWGTPVLVHSTTDDIGQYLSMTTIQGSPAIAYYNATTKDLEYVRASNANGSSWGTPITLWGIQDVGRHPSLTTINGNPAVAFEDVTSSRLLYIRANDNTGSSWPGFPTIIAYHRAEEVDLLEVNGKPAIAYYTGNGAQDLRYAYSQDANGTNWNTPILLDDGSAAVGSALSMAIIDGNPAISYSDYTNADLKYIRSSQVTGLPVELTFFKGEMTEQGTELTWQTATEEINEGFEVQRSVDGQEWQVLDFVYGNGTTVDVQDYDYLDTNPLEGTTYYRLKQIDFDGQFEYSDIIEVSLDAFANDLTTIYPTVVSDILNIEGGGGKVLIYNNIGQPVTAIQTYENQAILNLESLPNGQYYLRLMTPNNNSIKTFTFIKIE